MSWRDDIRVVIGLDFGTTYSGFSLCHVDDDDDAIIKNTNDRWPGLDSELKTNTVLQYDEDFKEPKSWGYKALCDKPKRRGHEKRPVELFKLYLGNCIESCRPKLPLPYKQAITDYLCEIGKLIKETVAEKWPGIDFMKDVLLVLTIPAEYVEKDKAIMRECAFNAELIGSKYTEKLQFTTEPEAAAIYCMYSSLGQHGLAEPGTTFMIVDCGGGTVDLTTRKLLNENQLGEVTERSGDFYGSTFVDKEFIKLLEREVGKHSVDVFRENHYGQMQYMVQEFCRSVKIPFTGESFAYEYEMDLEEYAPALKGYVTDDYEKKMLKNDWCIKFDTDTIKSMFDPIVDRIVEMVDIQLTNSKKCTVMFLVGGFSQSKYLQKAIKSKFGSRVENISVPTQPIAAVVRGATLYGKNLRETVNLKNMNKSKYIIASRILNHTFGIALLYEWEPGDPIERMTIGGNIQRFRCIAQRGTEATVDQEFPVDKVYPLHSQQTRLRFEVYYTKKESATYCDEDGVEKLGDLLIDLPDVHLGRRRPVTFKLAFGSMEIKASAFNQTNGQNYQTTFELNHY